MVLAILKQNPDDRIPLIKIFEHPWVLAFQQKYNIFRQPDSDSEDESSLDEDYGDEESSDEEENKETLADIRPPVKKQLIAQPPAPIQMDENSDLSLFNQTAAISQVALSKRNDKGNKTMASIVSPMNTSRTDIMGAIESMLGKKKRDVLQRETNLYDLCDKYTTDLDFLK